jgi:hypothetical protein
MAISILESINLENLMARGDIFGRMGLCMKEILLKERKQAKEGGRK